MSVLTIILVILGISMLVEILNRPKQKEIGEKRRSDLQVVSGSNIINTSNRPHHISVQSKLGTVDMIKDLHIDPRIIREKDRISENLRVLLSDPTTFIIIETANHTITIKNVAVFYPNGDKIHEEDINTRTKVPGIITFLKRYPDIESRLLNANKIIYYFETELNKTHFLNYCSSRGVEAEFFNYQISFSEQFYGVKDIRRISQMRELMFSDYFITSNNRFRRSSSIMEEIRIISNWKISTKEFIEVEELSKDNFKHDNWEHIQRIKNQIKKDWCRLPFDFFGGGAIEAHFRSQENQQEFDFMAPYLHRIGLEGENYYFRFTNTMEKRKI